MKLAILTIIMIFLAGCSLQKEVAKSDDFGESIILERSGMFTQPEYQTQIFTLTQTNLRVETYGFDAQKTNDVNFSLHPGITYEIFEEFHSINFTNLSTIYQSNINVADIGQGVFSYNNHTVLITPYMSRGNPFEIEQLINSFGSLLSQINMSEVFLIETELGNEIINYTYTGVQCVEELWMINSPTRESEWMKIQKYYENQGIEIEDIQRIESDMMQCQACNVCSKGYSYEIQVSSIYETLEDDGWTLK
jgi:hypothetical protein